MKIKDMKIGTRLGGGIVIIMFVLCCVILFQINRMNIMGEMQDEGAKRTADAIQVMEIDMGIDETAMTFADAII